MEQDIIDRILAHLRDKDQFAPDPYYMAADIFVFPSFSESFGNAIIEAMAHGLPVVTTSVGVVNEWPEEAPVYRFNGDDSDDFAHALNTLIRQGEQRHQLGQRASTFIGEQYSTGRICAQYEELYAGFVTG